jgi:hypothetical protein
MACCQHRTPRRTTLSSARLWIRGAPASLNSFRISAWYRLLMWSSALAARNDPREGLFEILDVKQLRPSHYQIYN